MKLLVITIASALSAYGQGSLGGVTGYPQAAGGGGGGATTPSTSLPLCGAGASNSTKACTAGTDFVSPTDSRVTGAVQSFISTISSGASDNTAALQADLAKAKAAGVDSKIFIPTAGTYTFTTATSAGSYVVGITDSTNRYSISLECAPGVILSTSQVGLSFMKMVGKWQASSVKGCTFSNGHGVTTSSSIAIFADGGSPQNVSNIDISGNNFTGWSQGTHISGANNINWSKNHFYLPNGRDSGTGTNAEPNVGLWLQDTTAGSGNVASVQINGNTYDGCSGGTVGSTSHQCGDGLVRAEASGVTATANDVKHFSFEGIYLWPEIGTNLDGTPVAPSTISGNSVDGTMLSGDTAGGGQYCIRADANGVTVSGNTLTNCLQGVWVFSPDSSYATAIKTADFTGVKVINNTVNTTAAMTMAITAAIGLTGVSGPNSIVSGNTINFLGTPSTGASEIDGILWQGVFGRGPSYSTGVQVSGNILTNQFTSATNVNGLYYQFTDPNTWSHNGNSFNGFNIGFHTANMGTAGAPTIATATQMRAFVTQNQFLKMTYPNFSNPAMTGTPNPLNGPLRDFISVRDYGAVGDGTTNDTTAINNALNAAATYTVPPCVYFPQGNYKVTTIQVPHYSCLKGDSSPLGVLTTSILGTTGSDTLIPRTADTGDALNWTIDGIGVFGGLNGIHITGPASWVSPRLTNSSIFGTNNGVLVDESVEKGRFSDSLFAATGTGCAFNLTNSGDSNNYMDKTTFLSMRFSGGVGGFCSDTFRVSNNNTFINPNFTSSQKYGMKILGATNQMYIIDASFELIGDPVSQPAASAAVYTTGTTSSTNATVIVVASATGFANGNTITVQGGSTHGTDYSGTISSIAGTSITVSPAIPSQVAGTEVTNATGILIQIGDPTIGSGNSQHMKIETSQLFENPENLLYAANMAKCVQCVLDNVLAGARPIYDPLDYTSKINTQGTRTATDNTVGLMLIQFNPVTYNLNLPTVFPFNPGQGGIFSCLGSSGGLYASGTFGKMQVGPILSGGGISPLLTVDCDSGISTLTSFSTAAPIKETIGTAIASATTIAPIAQITHITGTTAIATITLPAGMSSTIGGCITLIADAAWTTTTAGNIQAAMTATANTAYQACYGGTKWYLK